jgi:hypothetical protein
MATVAMATVSGGSDNVLTHPFVSSFLFSCTTRDLVFVEATKDWYVLAFVFFSFSVFSSSKMTVLDGHQVATESQGRGINRFNRTCNRFHRFVSPCHHHAPCKDR